MVTDINFCVNMALVGNDVLRAQDMVDAHIDTVMTERPPRTVSCGDEAVGESFIGYDSSGERQGVVIEITTDDDGIAAMLPDELRHLLCLR